MNKSEIEFIKSFSDYYFDDIHNSIFIKDQNFLLRFHLDLMKDEKIKNILNKNPEEFYAEVNTVVISEFTNRNEFMQINNSLTTKLYNALNVYYSLYTQIPFYTIRVSDDENQSELLYEIILNKSESINIQGFYTTLNSSQITLESTSDISTKSINKWSQIKYSNQILIIQTNTKARRIGYLKFIMNLFEQSSYFPISYLAKKIELEASVVQESLIEYKENFKGDDKGLIKKTQSGISAQPYIDLLRELNIITQINTSYILTKQAKIYLVLNKERHHFESEYNIFKLDIIDKLFFLKQFLIRDPLYLWSILDIILICNKPLDSSTIKKLFVNYILNELERNNLFTNNNQLKRSISELKKRIKSWNKPIVYLEHIIEPRINWLLDLGLLEQTIENTNVKKYVLTCSGNKFMTVLLGVYESTLTKQQSINSYLDKNYFEVFNYIFELDKRKDILNIKKIEEYLLDAFKLFKTEAPNRIAATQAIEYVCYKSFIEDGVIVEFDELKNYLIKENNIFTLDWFNTENDGALYVKKKTN